MLIDEVINFLKNIPPFQFLENTVLKDIAESLSMDFYPKDTVILKRDDSANEYLFIIKKGGVKITIRSEAGEDVLIDYRGEGEVFGLRSLIGNDRQKTNVIADDDTICYLLNKDKILQIIKLNPLVTEYFLEPRFNRYIEKTYSELHSKSLFYGSDHLLFTTQIGELLTKKVITTNENTTIQESAKTMAKMKVSSLIVVDDKDLPVGIVTDKDLRKKVVAEGRAVSEPIRNIMNQPVIHVNERDSCFEAVLKMIRHNIHHLPIMKGGELTGILTNHDLMLLQGISPLSFVKDIENQQTIDGLIPVSNKIKKVISLLLKEGARASNIARIITELNDRLVRKILEIAEKEHGPPPVPYCWIVFGSEGRKEQTIKTDQDNAIIYADVSKTDEIEAQRYFSVFAVFVRDNLVRCGFPLCPANYMASNPEWCRPLSVWKQYFTKWITNPTPDSILKSLIFFDFRAVFGALSLADELRNHLAQTTKGQDYFFAEMANAITKNRPPLSILKKVVVEKSGEHRNELNLKIRGIVPIVDIARIFAIDSGISETSTIGRIRLIKDDFPILKKYAEAIEEAFEFISLLRIYNQIEQLEKGEQLDNYINPEKLSMVKKKTLKESFNLISEVQEVIVEKYVPEFMRG